MEHYLPPYPEAPPLGDPKGPELIRVYRVGPKTHGDEIHQYFQPVLCVHCLDAPCIRACPCSAIYKDIETGITLVNKDRCIGCMSCLGVCPYGAPRFDDGILNLCDLCIHRLGKSGQAGRYTACEAACPARAIHVGTTDELCHIRKESSRTSREGREEDRASRSRNTFANGSRSAIDY